MRISLAVYALVYVMIELVGARLEQLGWPELTPLDVAGAVVHALLAVSIGVAVLLSLDLLGRHWRRARQQFPRVRAHLAEPAEPDTVTVASWRPAQRALAAGPTPVTCIGPDYADTGEGRLPLYVPSEILDRGARRL